MTRRVMTAAVVLFLSGTVLAQINLDPVRPQDYQRTQPVREPAPRRAPAELPEPQIELPDDQSVLVEQLKAVIFLNDPDNVIAEGAQGDGVVTSALPLLDSPEFRTKVQPYLGKQVTWESIGEIVRLTILYYRANDRPVVDVIIPEQEITNGVLQLLVIEGKLGTISVAGNNYFSDELIREKIRLKPGEPIYANKLLGDVDYINENPFRYVRPVLGPGEELGTTDLTLQTEDRFPYRFYVGMEDTGSRETELLRHLYGINAGNLFGKDIEAGYQFATNPHYDGIFIHSGYVRIPLANRHKLALYGSYASYDVRHIGLDIQGRSWQTSLRYIMPLDPIGRYRHELQFGYDFKRTDNNLELNFTDVYDGDVDTSQLVIQYSGDWLDAYGETAFTVAGYWSPCKFTTGMDTEDYEQARAQTSPDYIYGNVVLERTWDLPWGMTLVNRFIGQASSDPLQGSEQLGMGGYNTVRGYDEREINADEGIMTTIELRSPEIRVGRFANRADMENRLQFLGFWDYGASHNIRTIPGEVKTTELQSIGLGMRYRMGNYISFRLDYGHRLGNVDHTLFNDDGRLHFGMILAY